MFSSYSHNENPSIEENSQDFVDDDNVISYQTENTSHFAETEYFAPIKSEALYDHSGSFEAEEDLEDDDGDLTRKPSLSDASDESNYSSLLGPPKKASTP